MTLIYTRSAKQSDLEVIMQIIQEAKNFLKDSGSSQWQGTYPDKTTIQDDIENGYGLVLIVDGQVAGYSAVITGIEPTYINIEGSWKNNKDVYATIHRMAISSKFRGMHLADKFLSNIISVKYAEGVRNFRIDTSRKNKIVQHIATSHNFEERGIIYVDEDPEDKSRLAYELNL
ncbi:GNAT family N-acetyltransferase [Lactobacillus sp. LL6]|uniref:GNAT family N-acetyltransferase n=1 Tax=Lactobacillus sp. LL6 TaxID=2596827 RepID=UPI0011859526|nr:GNAT family N-acetyltransferase [Lactobacillus sp. LL6]TSO26781.1 GNAT family N-acetyltransferase [Lactobacillus sp. LL6]